MDDDTQKIIGSQIGKLPHEVITFISSTDWVGTLNELGLLYNLSPEELSSFKREVSIVLVGLVRPDKLSEVLEKEAGIRGAVLEALVSNVEAKIFASIHPALVSFFEKEAKVGVDTPAPLAEVPKETPPIEHFTGTIPLEIPAIEKMSVPEELSPTAQMWGKISGAAPDNLPIAEELSPLFPQIQGKPKLDEDVDLITHPFEEKMKQVFTGGQQTMEDFAIEPTTPAPTSTAPAPQEPKAPPIYHADPYREAIE